MPTTSKKQFNFMQGIAHGMKPKKRGAGPSKEVAKEMIAKSKKK